MARTTRRAGARAASISSEVLEATLREVCSARLARAETGRPGGGVRDPSGPAGDVRGANVMLVDMLRARRRGNVDLCSFLNRSGTRVLAASPKIAELMTSFAEVDVPRDVARALAAIVAELAYVSETSSPPDRMARLFVAIDLEGDEFVLAVACPEAAVNPVPTSAAAACLARAGTLATLLGGSLVRGVRDGSMLYGTTFARGAGS